MKLNDLQVQSFVTALRQSHNQKVQGGGWNSLINSCPVETITGCPPKTIVGPMCG